MHNAGQRPPFENTADEAAAEMPAAAANVGFINEIDQGAMTDIEIGIATFRLQVEGVEWEVSVVASGYEGVIHVVDGVRIRVGGLELEAVRELLLQVDLHAMVDGIADGFVQQRAGPRRRRRRCC